MFKISVSFTVILNKNWIKLGPFKTAPNRDLHAFYRSFERKCKKMIIDLLEVASTVVPQSFHFLRIGLYFVLTPSPYRKKSTKKSSKSPQKVKSIFGDFCFVTFGHWWAVPYFFSKKIPDTGRSASSGTFI
jgi:hypothetical protein